MQDVLWRGTGPVFNLTWGGRDWTLKVDGPRPGLCLEEGETSRRLLALDRLERPGCCDIDAFSGATLVGYERHRT